MVDSKSLLPTAAFENKAPGTNLLESDALSTKLPCNLLARLLLVCAWTESRITEKSGAGNVKNGESSGSVGGIQHAIDLDTDS